VEVDRIQTPLERMLNSKTRVAESVESFFRKCPAEHPRIRAAVLRNFVASDKSWLLVQSRCCSFRAPDFRNVMAL
jgi:hypothetical protein